MKTRIVIIAFFVGVNLILGSYFLLTVRGRSLVPESVNQAFVKYGLVSEDHATFPLGPAPDYSLRIDLESEDIEAAINEQRVANDEDEVASSARLHQAAEIVLEELQARNFEISNEVSNVVLEESLKEAGYLYSSAYQSVVIGPVTSTAVVEYWFNTNQQETVLARDVTEIGVATQVETIESEFTGVTVVILAKPRGVTAVQPASPKPPAKPVLPSVSDDEVITALNQYRQTHKKSPLKVHDDLCSYAEKRVGDLVANGGLDNHKGFQDDFADTGTRPEALEKYSGNKIGENLAHQFCRNMTTGDSFVAETGTALIEWCFDSSTKGHREAQLSSEFKNVCVRHADGMYVVIFRN